MSSFGDFDDICVDNDVQSPVASQPAQVTSPIPTMPTPLGSAPITPPRSVALQEEEEEGY